MLIFGSVYSLYVLRARDNPMIGDEIFGISGGYNLSFGELLRRGPKWEVNNSPLHYVVDRALLAIDPAPHRSWDLFVFFRLLPALFTCLAALVALIAITRALEGGEHGFWTSLYIAASFTLFLALKPYVGVFALQDRPYSLWLLLSALHLALFLNLYRNRARLCFAAYAISSTLLVLTAYVSALQVCLAGLVLWLMPPEAGRAREGKRQLKLCGFILLVAAWYVFHTHRSDTMESQHKLSSLAFLDLLAAAFRPFTPLWHERDTLHNWELAGPLLRAWSVGMLLLPLARWKQKDLRPLLLFCYGLIFSLLPISVVLEVQGYRIGGSRYLYFLFPALCSLFLLSALMLAGGAAKALGLLRFPRRAALAIAALLVFSPLAGHALYQQWRDISTKLFFERDFFVRPFFGLEAPATCPESFSELRGLHNTVDIRGLRARCIRTGME